MAGYTKADYDTAYSIRVLVPVPGKPNNFKRSPIRLHYHRVTMEATIRSRWDRIVSILGIASADKVVVVGAGYGWGVERLIELTSCQAVGIDISDYINSTKDGTEEAEIDAAIIAAGFDPASGHGLEVRNVAYTAELKSKKPVLKNDLSTNKARNDVKKEFGNTEPTWIITEDMLTDFSDAEIAVWKSEAEKLTTTKICHVLRENYPPNSKTAEDWNATTGHKIIALGSYRVVG